MSIKSWAKTKNWGSLGEKLAKCGIETTAVMQIVQQKYMDIACKANFSLLIWDRQLKLMLQHPTVWSDREQSKYPSKELLLYDLLHKRMTWCLKDCDKQRLQTTVSINLSKSFAGHTGDWFDVKTASICTTELWDALKNFILTGLEIKVASYPIIVSLEVHALHNIVCIGLASATSQPRNRQNWFLTMIASHTKACWEIVDRPKNGPALVWSPISFEMWRTELWRSCQNRPDLSIKK